MACLRCWRAVIIIFIHVFEKRFLRKECKEHSIVCMLLARRDEACRCFISNVKESGLLVHLLPQPTNVTHGYGLRSGFARSEFRTVRTDRLSNFVTHSYNRI